MTVAGIGGLFFRSTDPEARAAWYREHLGIAAGHDGIWRQEAGMTVFAPFPANSDYFGAEHSFMLNLRVRDLGALLTRLAGEGVAIERRPEWEATEYGSFARIHDPEGLAIELWEPPDESPAE